MFTGGVEENLAEGVARARSGLGARWLGVIAVLAFVAAVGLWFLPRSAAVTSGLDVDCGSALRPATPEDLALYCQDVHSAPVLWSAVLLVVAVAFTWAALIRAAPDAERAERRRLLLWFTWPAIYLIAVVCAAVATYAFVVETVAATDDVSGLEYLLQLLVATPLGWSSGFDGVGHGATGSVIGLLVAGLVQVGIVTGICWYGYRRGQRRSERPAGAPVA